ncbi:hypothetical protein STVIR_6893 [Streptomyces viridochromogenes Tue57]|uniref:Uncharacterized protein n=1 Tax=Streptomyces viridochromogenes Tue57 TaxID=1160705 RepID=L8P7E5_STRVR|nr:hypothetical protein STVIR_6893 [Streptomyces viridochromogenes Tue57]
MVPLGNLCRHLHAACVHHLIRHGHTPVPPHAQARRDFGQGVLRA